VSRDQENASARLARYLETRADEIDLDWVAVAREAGITVETLRAVRRGNNRPSRATRKGLDRALRWEPGSVAAILEYGEPTPVHPTGSQQLEDVRRMLASQMEDLDAIEAELHRRWAKMWKDHDRTQLDVLLRTLRELQGNSH
jgi:DNA-binding transcriptional MerR regulator